MSASAKRLKSICPKNIGKTLKQTVTCKENKAKERQALDMREKEYWRSKESSESPIKTQDHVMESKSRTSITAEIQTENSLAKKVGGYSYFIM